MTHVVDTHALIWFIDRNPKLGPRAKAVMDDPNSSLLLPAIALAEACWVVGLGRTAIPSSVALLAAVKNDSRFSVDPLDAALIERSEASDARAIPEMHDRQIVASALRLIDDGRPTAILTADSQIVASGLVPVIW